MRKCFRLAALTRRFAAPSPGGRGNSLKTGSVTRKDLLPAGNVIDGVPTQLDIRVGLRN